MAKATGAATLPEMLPKSLGPGLEVDDAPPANVPSAPTTGWLRTSGNKILREDGSIWHGRGANLHDTRSCDACAWSPPNAAEVKRRIDELVDVWKANFIRLDLESYGSDEGRASWKGVLDDPQYLADVQDIVAHIGQKPGVYVMVSLWIDPSFSDMGWPTAQTHPVWVKLAQVFKDSPHVLFGLVNEPQYNYDGSQNASVWTAMNETVEAIRQAEAAVGSPAHVVAVQGTGGWSRFLSYYVDHPIAAGGGKNVAYEVHVYDSKGYFADRFEKPAQALPVIVGEFGPTTFGGDPMTLDDCANLMDRAEAIDVPYLAWTFHMRCPPNLLVDNSGGGCGVGMKLEPTPWGKLLKDRLAVPW